MSQSINCPRCQASIGIDCNCGRTETLRWWLNDPPTHPDEVERLRNLLRGRSGLPHKFDEYEAVVRQQAREERDREWLTKLPPKTLEEVQRDFGPKGQEIGAMLMLLGVQMGYEPCETENGGTEWRKRDE